MTSTGSGLADNTLFEKNGFLQEETKNRFQPLAKTWSTNAKKPQLRDRHEAPKQYKGWHVVYADQCPWHEKSAVAIKAVAEDQGITITITKMTSSEEAQLALSGFGIFNLLYNSKLLEDHYISATRFKNILKKN